MKIKKILISILILLSIQANVKIMAQDSRTNNLKEQHFDPKVIKTADEWKATLSPVQYEVTRNPPYTKTLTSEANV